MLSSLQNVAPMLQTFTLLPCIFHPMPISTHLPTHVQYLECCCKYKGCVALDTCNIHAGLLRHHTWWPRGILQGYCPFHGIGLCVPAVWVYFFVSLKYKYNTVYLMSPQLSATLCSTEVSYYPLFTYLSTHTYCAT